MFFYSLSACIILKWGGESITQEIIVQKSIYRIEIVILMLIIWMPGCVPDNNIPTSSIAVPSAVMEASYTNIPIIIDGNLDEKGWNKAKVYELQLSRNQNNKGPKEKGMIRFAWDNKYFYLGASFKDSDIVAEGKVNNLHHYKFGDVCELFLKPASNSWYWELHATPNNKKTVFWYPSRGRLGLPSSFEDYTCGLEVASQHIGTLNDWTDVDNGWTVEMAVSIKDLTARGERFGIGTNWRILVGRHNYSKYLGNRELSMAPKLSQMNFHSLEEYAMLQLIK